MGIYLTWHLPSHGIHYTKNILAAFWAGKANLGQKWIKTEGMNQEELELAFEKETMGFKFDKVYYLHPDQLVQDNIHVRSPKKKWDALKEDQLLINSPTQPFWERLIEQKNKTLKQDLHYLAQHIQPDKPEIYDQMLSEFWRVILDYPIEDQLYWFKTYSNARHTYGAKKRFEAVNLSQLYGLQDMRNYEDIAKAVGGFVKATVQRHTGATFTVNISLGSYETQVVWFLLAEAKVLPAGTRFISVYDRKDDPHNARYKDFTIKEVQPDLLRALRGTFDLFKKTKSPVRQLAQLKMQHYLKTGFAILLVGPRGIGKTSMVQANTQGSPKTIIEANCAAFADDTMAEAELFGHTDNAFTGARREKKGLFAEANGGILFLDEIHHLSKTVQSKLMTALQTNEKNELTIRRLGASKVEKIKCTVIMATNRSIAELKERLLPDFFDRIVQHVIEIPALSETPEDREEDWKRIWAQLRFAMHAPTDPELITWLRGLKLEGNFRDLQKIAIYYHAYLGFDEDIKAMLSEKTAFEFAKKEYETYHLGTESAQAFQFSASETAEHMIKRFKFELATWAVSRFGGKAEAARHFQSLGEKTSRKTIHDWLGLGEGAD